MEHHIGAEQNHDRYALALESLGGVGPQHAVGSLGIGKPKPKGQLELSSPAWHRPYFENYIVDASILDLTLRSQITLWSSFKEHTVDALAIGAEEGRSNLR